MVRRLVEKLLGNTLVSHSRRSAIYSIHVLTPYPFQAHLYGLPCEAIRDGLTRIYLHFAQQHPICGSFLVVWILGNFCEWILGNFCEGIAEDFVLPFNEKLWNAPLEKLTTEWIGLVPRPLPQDVINGAFGLGDRECGYNARFFYPRSWGSKLSHLHCLSESEALTTRRKSLRFKASLGVYTLRMNDGTLRSHDCNHAAPRIDTAMY